MTESTDHEWRPINPLHSSADDGFLNIRNQKLALPQGHSDNTMNSYVTDSETSVEEHSLVTKRGNGQPMIFSAFFAKNEDEFPRDEDNSPVAKRGNGLPMLSSAFLQRTKTGFPEMRRTAL
jgi:hypothetical protein